MKKRDFYPKDQSPLFNVQSKSRLGLLLGVSQSDLRFLLRLQNYREWQLSQKRSEQLARLKPAKPRLIQEPKPLLRSIHKKLAVLLARIAKPSFVYSATKNLSYVDNAKQHTGNDPAVKIDIKSFYPSVKQKSVRNFFERQMKCAPDVAHFIARICCVDGALPTGSPLSPILSYFACSTLFGVIDEIASSHNVKFTLYVDDMVFSGSNANLQFSRKIKRELAKAGFIGHKICRFPANCTKVITGVAVNSDSIEVPFRRQGRIRKFEHAFWTSTDREAISILGAALLGQYREAERLQRGSRLRAGPVTARLNAVQPQSLSIKPKPRIRRKVRRNLDSRELSLIIASLRKADSLDINSPATLQTLFLVAGGTFGGF